MDRAAEETWLFIFSKKVHHNREFKEYFDYNIIKKYMF